MAYGIVYCIFNEYNGYCYIGSTLYEKQRLARHLRHLRKNKHINKLMQEHFNDHGEEYFKIQILHRNVPENELHIYELSEIVAAGYNNGDKVYNVSKVPRISACSRKLLTDRRNRQVAVYSSPYRRVR